MTNKRGSAGMLERDSSTLSGACRRLLFATLVAVGSLGNLAAAQNARCLADVSSHAGDLLAYQPRETRCEGALPRYVASAADIRLVGYRANTYRLRIPGDPAVSLVALGSPAGGEVAVRALSLTSTYRYQMDHAAAKIGEVFVWPLDVASRAIQAGRGHGLDPATLGIVACDNRCSDRPDTTYWPIAVSSSPAVQLSKLTLLLRSGVRAERMRIDLVPLDGTAGPRPIAAPGEPLLPDVVRAIDLPLDLPSGRYRITVDARDRQMRALGSLRATIFVPGSSR